jgi:hypothetical protein
VVCVGVWLLLVGRLITERCKPWTPTRRTYTQIPVFLSSPSITKQIRSVVGQIRPDRQTLLFSATFKRRVERLAQVRAVAAGVRPPFDDMSPKALLLCSLALFPNATTHVFYFPGLFCFCRRRCGTRCALWWAPWGRQTRTSARKWWCSRCVRTTSKQNADGLSRSRGDMMDAWDGGCERAPSLLASPCLPSRPR